MGRVTVRIDDPEIASVALYVPLPRLQRLDVLPFLLLYATAVGLYLTRPSNDAVPVLFAAITVFAHALTFLVGEWSVSMSAWLGFAPMERLPIDSTGTEPPSAAAAVYVKVLPARAMLPKQLVRCVIVSSATTANDNEKASDDVPLLWFSYQNQTFCLFDDLKAFHAGLGRFRRLDFPTQWPLRVYTSTKGFATPQSVTRAQLKYGKNDFEIPIPLFSALLKEQLVAPFFVFQFFCMLLWCLDEYVYYSLMTLGMLVVFECTVVKQRQHNMEMLNGMRRVPQLLFVFRDKKWQELWSDQLVPGDLCSIGQKLPGVLAQKGDEKYTNVPCDLLLLRGNCVVNESMLTGESVPLRKEPLESQEPTGDGVLCIDDGTAQHHKKHVLFSGTKILQHALAVTGDSASTGTTTDTNKDVPHAPDKGCLAFVLRTGFGTTQGSLMRTILHSSQRVTANNVEAMYFILLLLGFAIAAASVVLHHGLHDPTRNKFKLFLHCIMIVTSVVPPELPMELSLAVTNSLLALTRQNIFCTEPFRIPLAGRVDVCCFDKTGTLTSDELKMHGVAGLQTRLAGSEGHENGLLDLVAPSHLPLDTELVLAGCQSLVFIHGQVMGDPLEVTALHNIKWSLAFGYYQPANTCSTVEPTFFSPHRGVIESVTILHRFLFSSELKRMTTIVSIKKGDNDEEDELRVLTKGAPEVLEHIFAEKPAQYSRVYRHFASKGCRVLALGYRRLAPLADSSVEEFVRQTPRCEIEKDLVFAGFLVLDCPLKEDTKRIIRDLVRSNHKIIVITGDNALTACDAARQIGLNAGNNAKPPLLLSQKKKTEKKNQHQTLEWQAVDDESNGGGEGNEQDTTTVVAFEPHKVELLSRSHDLCVTGDALLALQQQQQQQDDDQDDDDSHAFDKYLGVLSQVAPFVNVFARTSPQQKEHILMALNRAGKTTAMCGDGTNDVGALKRAHVGVSIVNNPDAENSQRSLAAELAMTKKKNKKKNGNSLEERLRAMQQEEDEMAGSVRLGDASIASPFTSKSSSIRVVKQLIRQGRCTLVTTIQMYKILGVNCLITAYYLSSLYIHGVKNGDQQLTIVGLSIAMFFLFLARTKPAKKLSSTRPPSGVFCWPVLLSIMGQFGIHLFFLVAALDVAQPFIDHSDPSMHPDGKFTPNVVNTIMFLMAAVMQLTTFVANYKGQPFMESFWHHKLLCRSALVSYLVLALAVLEVSPWLTTVLELVAMPNHDVQWAVCVLMAGDTLAVLGWEYIIETIVTARGN